MFDTAHRHCVSGTVWNVDFLEPIGVGAVSTHQKAYHMMQKVHMQFRCHGRVQVVDFPGGRAVRIDKVMK